MSLLLGLPQELLQRVCCNIEPRDVGRLARTCRPLKFFLDGNRLLYKEIYLNHFDRPANEDIDWAATLTSVVRVLHILSAEDEAVKIDSLAEVSGVLEYMLTKTAPWYGKGYSKNVPRLAELFRSRVNRDAFLCRSTLFGRAKDDEDLQRRPIEERQASAKLHCLFGVSIDVVSEEELEDDDDAIMTNGFARSKVYDLREYTDGSFWGPFMDDGSGDVDWEKAEAVMIDLCFNMRIFSHRTGGYFQPAWQKPFDGLSRDSFKAKSMLPKELAPPLELQDPYNISGTWFRIVCFLDYGDLHDYNFGPDQPAEDEPRPELHKEEAIRLIHMNLEVSDIEEPGKDDGKELPVVHFEGHSKSLHASWDPNANSDIRATGSVRLTPQGHIRWTTLSVYHGEERWRSEGIQLGGLRSSRGVIGHWFDKDFSARGPAGPTAFWKLSNEFAGKKLHQTSISGER